MADHPSETVNALLTQLLRVEHAMVANQRAWLAALDDDAMVGGLAALQAEAEYLDREAQRLVAEIREAVASSSPLAVFARLSQRKLASAAPNG